MTRRPKDLALMLALAIGLSSCMTPTPNMADSDAVMAPDTTALEGGDLEDAAVTRRCGSDEGQADPRCADVDPRPRRPERPAGLRIHDLPPDSSVFLCRGSVAGPPREGRPSSRISWQAFVSATSPEAVARDTTAALGEEPVTNALGCASWSLPGGRRVSVCPASASGPWTECQESIPAQAQTVIMESTLRPSR